MLFFEKILKVFLLLQLLHCMYEENSFVGSINLAINIKSFSLKFGKEKFQILASSN